MTKILNFFTILVVASIIAQGYSFKVRLCVSRQVEVNRCDELNKACLKHGLPHQFECKLLTIKGCLKKTKDGLFDAVIVDGHAYGAAKEKNLVPILYEGFSEDNVMVAIADSDLSNEKLQVSPVDYDDNDLRSVHSAMFINLKRGSPVCGGLTAGKVNTIQIVKSTDLEQYKNTNKKLLCPTLERKEFNEYKTCNIEADLVRAIVVPDTHANKNDIINAFKLVVENYGINGSHNNDFKLFGKYTDPGFNNDHVLFNDDTIALLDKPAIKNGVTEEVFIQIHCHGVLHERFILN